MPGESVSHFEIDSSLSHQPFTDHGFIRMVYGSTENKLSFFFVFFCELVDVFLFSTVSSNTYFSMI